MIRLHSMRARACWMMIGIGAMALIGGCQSMEDATGNGVNPALRPLQTGPDATDADKQRAALSRLVGVWTFAGWSGATADWDTRAPDVAGLAAGVVESGYFVLLDLDVTSGEFAGSDQGKEASMLFASEPGVGATVSAWGDAAPSISRLVGEIVNNGANFNYTELRTPEGRGRVSLSIEFVTDDHWIAEIRDAETEPHSIIARYDFQRLVE